MSRRLLLPVTATLVVLALLATGCVRRRGTTLAGRVRIHPREERQLRQQSSRELGCPANALTVTALTDRVYQVHGCGQLRDYALGVSRRRGWYPLQPVYLRASAEMACPLEQLQIAAPGPALRTATGCGRTARYDLVCGALECAWMMTAHGGAWAGETPQPAIAVATAPPAGLGTGAPATSGPASTGATMADPAASAAPGAELPASEADALAIPEPPAAGSAEAILRTALDARRDAIHRCAALTAVVVHASWSAEGAVAIALDPPLAGSTAEQCVRSAVGAQQVAPGAAGELVHTVL